jgi:hypothetical protein
MQGQCQLNILSKMCRLHNPWLMRNTILMLCLAITLVFTQGGQLHVHVYSHDSGIAVHEHKDSIHFNYDTSETGHPDQVAVIDLSQQGFLKKLSSGLLVIVLFVSVRAILPLRFPTRSPWQGFRNFPASCHFHLQPPQRGPPL